MNNERLTLPQGMQVLDGTMLKLIAMVCMAFGHVGDNFFPDQVWAVAVGRIAMPIFAFCISEGFSHTRDKRRYLARMGVFALVSEVPFDLVTSGRVLEFTHQNIMVTFFWAILGLLCFERIVGDGASKGRRALAYAVLVAFLVGSLVLNLDYNMLGVGLVFVFYLLRDKALLVRNVVAMAFHALLRNVGLFWLGLLGFLPIFFYNGRRGAGLKWLFYVFYPGHLLLIWLVRTLLG